MFWKRASRSVRRQQVMEELTDLDPVERRIRLNRAVADGDIGADELDVLLRTSGRLDDLKVMAIPSAYGRWPAGELIGAPAADDEDGLVSHFRSPRARARRRVAIDVGPDPATVRASRPVLRPAEKRTILGRRPVAASAGKSDDEGPNISWLRPS